MTALFGLGPTGPVSVQIGAGLSLNVNTLMATGAGSAAAQSLSLYALGNTTSTTTSAVNSPGSLSLSGAGIVSIGLSGSVYIISAAATAASATSMGQTALGNTTGSTSSQTRALTVESISFAGAVSGGFSGGTLVISGGTGTVAASGTAVNRTALGNTAGSTTSDVATLTQWTISAAGGLSAGMSAGTLVLSGATTAAQSVQTLGLFAVGNTTTSVSSMTADARSLSFDGAGAVSVGMSGGSVVISAPATIASGTVQNRFALGNTTSDTSSFANTLSILSVSGMGAASVGYDTNGVLIISAAASGTTAASATSMNMTAVGNTTGSSSATTRAITAQTFSGAGIVSVGFSGNSIIISAATAATNPLLSIYAVGNTTTSVSSGVIAAGSLSFDGAGGVSVGISGSSVVISGATTAASGTVQNRFAAGNTTAAVSSFANTLSIMSVSGAGGASVGYDTNGVLVISAGTGAAASATSMGLSAIGNTAGSTTSMTKAITAETISGAGNVSVGFSAGTVIVSGALTAVAGSVSYFQPTPFYSSTTMSLGGSMIMIPVALQVPLTINQVKMFLSGALSVATLTVGTNATSMTATASYANQVTNSLVHYSAVDATTYTSVGSTTLLMGMSQSWSVSQTGASNSVSCTITYMYGIGTTTSQDTFSTSSTTNTTSSYALNPAGAGSSSYVSVFEMAHAWPKSFAAGFQMIGALSTNVTARGTGSSLLSVSTGGIAPGWQLSQVGPLISGAGFRPAPGQAVGVGFPLGVGYTSAIGNTAPTSVIITALTYGANLLRIPYVEMGIF